MKIIEVRFDSPFIVHPDGPDHWRLATDLHIKWVWEQDGVRYPERMQISGGFRWDGASRPDFVGWLIPRGGVFLAASAVHDFCFKRRPYTHLGRITRQHTDLLFLALMRELAAERVTGGWKAPAQVLLAEVMYWFVRQFGERTWDKHDSEFRNAPR